MEHTNKYADFMPGELGVVQKLGPYFSVPSFFARQNLFCVYWADEYECEPPYRVERPQSDRDFFILFRIIKGHLRFQYRGEIITAGPEDVVVIDSSRPNAYWAVENVRFQFFHFNGNITIPYTEHLYQEHGFHFPRQTNMSFLFNSLIKELKAYRSQDEQISLLVHSILVRLSQISRNTTEAEFLPDLLEYLNKNYAENLSVDELAEKANMSKFYFSRIFRKCTGYSPHEYLVRLRLKYSMEYLSTTDESIDNIAAYCGFSSSSNYIRAFKKDTGVTPASFRKFFTYDGFSKVK